MSINRVNISGNLTRDPELRSTQSGMAVLQFGVAVNDRRKSQQTGEWEDHPNFIDCAMFGTRAEKLAPYLAKGTKVAIDGKLRYSSWEKDGQKRSKLDVAVDEIEFMNRRDDGGQQYAPRPYQQQYAPQPYQQQYAPQPYQQPQSVQAQPGLYDDDIPF